MIHRLLLENLSRNEESHVHDSYELILVLHGTLRCRENGEMHTLRAGNLLLINPGLIHTILVSEKTSVVRLWIPFSQISSLFPWKKNALFFTCSPASESGAASGAYIHIRSLMAGMALNFLKKPDGYQLKQEQDVFAILYCLYTQFLTDDGDTSAVRADPRLLEVFSYTQTHHEEPILMEDIADMLGLTAPYFSKMFKKMCGFTYHAYLTHTRLEYAVQDLLNSDLSILDVSEKHGFPNLNAFYKAFHAKFKLSPKQYREQHQSPASPDEEPPSSVSPEQTEDLLRNYMREKIAVQTESPVNVTNVAIDLNAESVPLPDSWSKIVNICSASDALLSSVQDDLQKVQKDIHFQYVHFHGIFDDSMHVYTKARDGSISISFMNTDRILDFFYSIGLLPYIELSYMPSALARKPLQDSISGRCCAPPVDTAQWNQLIEQFLSHCISRYGITEVEKWPVQIWENACFEDWWWGSFSEFCAFYRQTFRTIRQISPHARIGSPSVNAFAVHNSAWLENFLSYCAENDCMPDFLPLTVYPHGKDYYFTVENGILRPRRRSAESYHIVSKFARTSKDPDFLAHFLKELKRKVKKFGYTERELYLTEWNSVHMIDPIMADTTFNAAYLLKNLCENGTAAQSFGYSFITDAAEEYSLTTPPYHGGAGLINNIGIKKAGYYAYMMLARIKGRLLARGDGYYTAASEDGCRFYLLFYSYAHYRDDYCDDVRIQYKTEDSYEAFAAGRGRRWVISLHGITPGEYRIKQYTVNRAQGSSFDQWLKMGAPQSLDLDDVSYLQAVSVPGRRLSDQTLDSDWTFSVQLEPLEVCLYEITFQRDKGTF